jgi:dTDP-4-amino-4,6-dideoxygalactose transaminase
MVYPFMCDNKELRNYLIQRRIFCGSYWKEVVNRRPSNSVEYQFSQSIIALPIDQRFSLADMERIIHHIEYFFKQKQ